MLHMSKSKMFSLHPLVSRVPSGIKLPQIVRPQGFQRHVKLHIDGLEIPAGEDDGEQLMKISKHK